MGDKHFFFVHSNLTYLLSLGIILEEKISLSNVLIFSQQINFDYLPVKTQNINRMIRGNGLKNIFRQNEVILIDKYIDRVTKGSSFIIYMQSMLPIQKVFATHKSCLGIRFFEDGMANHFSNDSIDLLAVYNRNIPWRICNGKDTISFIIEDIKNLLNGFSPKFRNLPSWPTCYFNFDQVKYYTFSNKAFSGIPEKKKVHLSLERVFENFNYSIDLPDISNSTIWLSDNVVRSYRLIPENYVSIVSENLKLLIDKDTSKKSLFVKFHRAESKSLREATLKALTKLNIEFILIEDGIPMELVLLKSKNCKVVGIMTSLLYYAAIMGHQVFSLMKRFHIDSQFDFNKILDENTTITYI